jgi:hypothetical protein
MGRGVQRPEPEERFSVSEGDSQDGEKVNGEDRYPQVGRTPLATVVAGAPGFILKGGERSSFALDGYHGRSSFRRFGVARTLQNRQLPRSKCGVLLEMKSDSYVLALVTQFDCPRHIHWAES